MNLVKISNIFNSIVQLLPVLKYYHFGTFDEINGNPENNFNPDNSVGKQYPCLYFVPPSGAMQIDNSAGRAYASSMDAILIFADTMYYKNDSSNDVRTLAEIFRDLQAETINFFAALTKAGRSGLLDGRDKFNISGITYSMVPMSHNDRLAVIQCNFSIQFLSECETETPDLATLTPPFVFPPEDWDYEDQNHQ